MIKHYANSTGTSIFLPIFLEALKSWLFYPRQKALAHNGHFPLQKSSHFYSVKRPFTVLKRVFGLQVVCQVVHMFRFRHGRSVKNQMHIELLQGNLDICKT
jgi:hypothetical protein